MARMSLLFVSFFCVAGCSLEGGLPAKSPPLLDMEEPVALLIEPDDEAERQKLPAGTFTGIYVKDSRVGIDALMDEPEGVLIERIVENSPGALARLQVDDLLLSVQRGDGEPIPINWPSEWRGLELEAQVEEEWTLLLDRGGLELETRLRPIQRVAPAPRAEAQRFREEAKVGVVLRTATEVEARTVGLAPGAGAVIVGLSQRSPWRTAGLRFEDVLSEISGREVSHPQVVIDAINAAEEGGSLKAVAWRDAVRTELALPISSREGRLRDLHIPPLFRREETADRTKASVLYGLLGWESTEAAWEFTLLWFLTFSGGDDEVLKEVQP